MTLAEMPSTTLQNVHPGGFFWTVERSERETHLLRFVSQTRRIALVTNTAREANDYAERLTLSGVPVNVATDRANLIAIEAFRNDSTSSLVATHEYVTANGPAPAPLVVHLRAALSARDYAKRLDALPSAVHLTFVVPEDHKRANNLVAHFGHDHGHTELGAVEVGEVIDLTETAEIAMLANARRRFPLR